MPLDYYPNLTVQELEALLERAQDRKANGAVSSVSAAGVSTSLDLSKYDIEKEIRDILYSLYLRSAGSEYEYPNPYSSRVARVRPRYL